MPKENTNPEIIDEFNILGENQPQDDLTGDEPQDQEGANEIHEESTEDAEDADDAEEGQESGEEDEEGLLDLSFDDGEPETDANLSEFSEVERLIKSGNTDQALQRLQVHEQGLAKLKTEADQLRGFASEVNTIFERIAQGDVDAAISLEDEFEKVYGVRPVINPPGADEKPKVQKDTRYEELRTKQQELEERIKATDWANSDRAKLVADAVKKQHGIDINLMDVYKARKFLPKDAKARDAIKAAAKVNSDAIIDALLDKANKGPKPVPESVKLRSERKSSGVDLRKLWEDDAALRKLLK